MDQRTCYHDVLGAGHEGLAANHFGRASATEAGLVMQVIAEQKQFDLEWGAADIQNESCCPGDRFKGHLRIQANRGPQAAGQIGNGLLGKLNDDVGVAGGSGRP